MTICKFFNTQKGCAPPSGECSHEHVLYCTNELCAGAAAKTHTLKTCGRKGGGGHEAFIAQKKAKAIAAKAVAKPSPSSGEAEAVNEVKKAKNAIGEILYTQVQSLLTDDDNAGYKAVMKDFPISLPSERIAGKVVGMLLEGLDLTELIQLKTDKTALQERVVDAVEVLYQHELDNEIEKPVDK
jgi:hypothetical protein